MHIRWPPHPSLPSGASAFAKATSDKTDGTATWVYTKDWGQEHFSLMVSLPAGNYRANPLSNLAELGGRQRSHDTLHAYFIGRNDPMRQDKAIMLQSSDAKSLTASAMASGWPADWLVIWQRITSPRVKEANTKAGRTLELERSVNGKGTTTTSPLTNRAMPHPPPACPSPSPMWNERAAEDLPWHHCACF
jgi:hypothetical protein